MLDPSGLYMRVPLRAWHLVDGEYLEAVVAAEGIWWSRELPLGIGFHDEQAAVFDRAGRRQLREGEISTHVARQEAGVAELRRRLEELERRQAARVEASR